MVVRVCSACHESPWTIASAYIGNVVASTTPLSDPAATLWHSFQAYHNSADHQRRCPVVTMTQRHAESSAGYVVPTPTLLRSYTEVNAERYREAILAWNVKCRLPS